jgi:hypothetical protein
MKHRASQTQIIRIVLMVPIYAWASWFSLWFLEYAVYLDFVRVCYEAFVIYSFLVLLTKYLGGNTAVLKVLRSLPQQTWPSPLCCLPKVMPNKKFYTSLLYGTLQYSVIMPLVAFVAGALNWLDLYGEGEIDWHYAYPYVALIQNFCQLAALYCLVWFWVCSFIAL